MPGLRNILPQRRSLPESMEALMPRRTTVQPGHYKNQQGPGGHIGGPDNIRQQGYKMPGKQRVEHGHGHTGIAYQKEQTGQCHAPGGPRAVINTEKGAHGAPGHAAQHQGKQ